MDVLVVFPVNSLILDEMSIRRIASNHVVVHGLDLGRRVVEMDGQEVKAIYSFEEELPFTEWMMEPIVIK